MTDNDQDRSPDKNGGLEEDETVIRHDADSSQKPTRSNGDRDSTPPASAADGDDDATVIRRSDPGPATPRQQDSNADDATVIRPSNPEPAAPRQQDSNADDATVIRPSNPEPAAPAQQDSNADDATVLRPDSGGGDGIGADDSTVIRSDDGGGAEDVTIMSTDFGDDATVIGGGPGGDGDADTTYIAAVGTESMGGDSSSDAGRLLKNRFVLEQKLGSGGMGDVYKALDLRSQEAQDKNPYVAIKLLNERFSQHQDAYISLQRESSKTRQMRSEHILAVYDFDREGDTYFMAMELLDGEPLDDYLKSHPEGVSRDDAWNIIRGVCEGLKAAHAENIVHSDFKPGNIYYTDDSIAKVFDFGIARAVQNPGTPGEGKEETVFDPGSLGALTPTYASYEMLTGEVPSKSDDVYAVALVAYELFAGTHPFNRVPADKALAQGLEPEPIPFLRRRHWKALRKGLEFTRENRTETIDEFMEGMFSEDLPILQYSIMGVVAAAIIGFGAYALLSEGPAADQELIATQSELNLRKEDLGELFSAPEFTEGWTTDVSEKLRELYEADKTLVDDFSQLPDPDVTFTRERAITLHTEEIQRLRELYSENGDYADAADHLARAETLLGTLKQHFNFDAKAIRSAELALGDAISRRDAERARIAQEAQERQAAADARALSDRRQREAKAARDRRDAAYEAGKVDLADHFKCKRGISDNAAFGDTIKDLQTTDPSRFESEKAGIIAELHGCIDRTKVRYPDVAKDLRAFGLTLFPGENALSSIKISALDPCKKRNLPGYGSRNRRWCADDLTDGGTGPDLVVVKGTRATPVFAVSRTEIKVGEYNKYCEGAGCTKLAGSSSLPATGISVDQARAYMTWLSDQSGRSYRLPTVDEWVYAAMADADGAPDPNVNCTVDSRGVRLGEKLVSSLSGKPNPWGLYHHVGNAQEWATKGGEIVARGGAHTDPKSECTIQMERPHTGAADPVTGFRVLREI